LRMLWKDKNWQKRLLFWLLFEELHNANRLSQMPPLYRIYILYCWGVWKAAFQNLFGRDTKKMVFFPERLSKKHIVCFCRERSCTCGVFGFGTHDCNISTNHISQWNRQSNNSLGRIGVWLVCVQEIEHTQQHRENERCSRIWYMYERTYMVCYLFVEVEKPHLIFLRKKTNMTGRSIAAGMFPRSETNLWERGGFCFS
jgi:hypothetical protein